MPLPEKHDHRISLPDAVALAKQHRLDHPGEPKAHFFWREAFEGLLAQPGTAGIRIYRGNFRGRHDVFSQHNRQLPYFWIEVGSDLFSKCILHLGQAELRLRYADLSGRVLLFGLEDIERRHRAQLQFALIAGIFGLVGSTFAAVVLRGNEVAVART